MTLPLQRITDFLDKAFKAPRSYYPVHIYDDSGVITRAESEKRIKFGLLITGIFWKYLNIEMKWFDLFIF